MEKNRKYRMSEELTEDNIKAFAESVMAGTAQVRWGLLLVAPVCRQPLRAPLVATQPDFKSAPIPEDPKENGVTVVVGKTAESIFFDESKDVLLEIYGAGEGG
jgi:hypothetical protein